MNWTKDNTILPDKDIKEINGGTRFCGTQADFEYCLTANPDSKVPCRLLYPKVIGLDLSDACPLTYSFTHKKNTSTKFLGIWETQSSQTSVLIQTYTCKVPWAIDSCRASKQNSVTSFEKDGSVFYDKKLDVSFIGCQNNEAAIADYAASVEAARPDLNAKMLPLNVKWKQLCPKDNKRCQSEMEKIWQLAVIDVNASLGSHIYTVKKYSGAQVAEFIENSYRSQHVEKVLTKSPIPSGKLAGPCISPGSSVKAAAQAVYGIEPDNNIANKICQKIDLSYLQNDLRDGRLKQSQIYEFLKMGMRKNDLERIIAIFNVYKDIMGREPSVADYGYWRQQLISNPIWAYQTIALEASNYLQKTPAERTETIRRVYYTAYGREPLPQDLAFWMPRKENYSEMKQAARDYLYSPNGKQERDDLIQRIYLARTNKRPDTGQYQALSIIMTIGKLLYDETLTIKLP